MFGPGRFCRLGPVLCSGIVWNANCSLGLRAGYAPHLAGRVADAVGAILRLAGRLERAADCLFRILRGTYERGVAPCGREPLAR